MPQKTITNAVLLEKLNNQGEQIRDLKTQNGKLDDKLTQNLESMARLLQESYAKREEVDHVTKRVDRVQDVTIPALRTELLMEMSKRVHKDSFKPIVWIGGAIGLPAIAGIVYLFGKMIAAFFQGGSPL